MLFDQIDHHVPLSAIGDGTLEEEGEEATVRLLPGDTLGRLHHRVEEIITPLNL